MTAFMSDPQRPADPLAALVALGIIDAGEAQAAQDHAAAHGTQALRHLHETKRVTTKDLVRATCYAAGVEFVDLVDYQVEPAALVRLTAAYAKQKQVLPLRIEGDTVHVAVTKDKPQDIPLRDDLTRLLGMKVKFVVAMREDLAEKINKVYRSESELAELAAGFSDEPVEEDWSNLTEAEGEDAPIVRLVNLIISQAIEDGASDIHIDPGEKAMVVRYRIDGVLKENSRFGREAMGALVSRIKIMANMNIAEKRVPQDGRLSVYPKGQKIDLRVASLPTVHGVEKIVMRILDNSTAQMSLEDLGFSEENFNRFAEAYRKPYGMILVTGPTGSGKSTTLYATVNIINSPAVNIITVEDPVEYRIAGITQMQVNKQSGMTFEAALRSILRADPDVILIGEIRDKETAQIAVESALTGHLVLSTLHTNDAPSAVTRLIELDVEPYLVGSAMDCVLAQRLCRRLCSNCAETYEPLPEQLATLRQFPWHEGMPLPTLRKARVGGCNHCSGMGYKGRMALHEVMTVTEDIERLATASASAEVIADKAQEQGMRTLRQDGWDKVLLGHTSIQEVLRVVV
jgi:type IV pilus assembly protein PilB